jgi:hypothetical protein
MPCNLHGIRCEWPPLRDGIMERRDRADQILESHRRSNTGTYSGDRLRSPPKPNLLPSFADTGSDQSALVPDPLCAREQLSQMLRNAERFNTTTCCDDRLPRHRRWNENEKDQLPPQETALIATALTLAATEDRQVWRGDWLLYETL